MKLQLLNKKIQSEHVLSVLFPFPPIALPINDDGRIETEESATKAHFATIVFNIDDAQFYILEFGERIKDGLLAYRSRHKTISNVEILLSREDDGILRMTSGKTADHLNKISKDELESLSICHDKLYDIYKLKIGKQIQDFER